ncbi:Cof-type HAD-IIB family hydrolase [Companilactobacillus zhongbaensis]|uniref:Cof-type HAD-IIB family hydrolase n=1 Tax=Companilactobacillus zhongbaensis TaxID=2486009 RepID=UPI000F783EA4|nr:Cof-type HAD-IIB family hydrolase [Companilactobacillus zhongbaensis]
MISFIGTDLDGTLLNSHQEISVENIRAIRMAVSEGINFGICSGRSLRSVMNYLDNILQVPGFKMILNGAVVLDQNNQKISDRPLAKVTIDQMLQQVENSDFKVVLDSLNETYVYDQQQSGSTYYAGFDPENIVVTSLSELRKINDDPQNIFYKVSFSSEDNAKLMKKIETFTSLPVVISRSGENYYEVNALDCTKLSALQRISAVTKLSLTNFMCFGDYGNDLEMIDRVGYGVAMDNAREEVKNVADYITKTNNQNGVALMINKVLSGEIN